MSLWDQLRALFAPAPRGMPELEDLARHAVPPMTAPLVPSPRTHADSMVNLISGLGGVNDSGAAARPNVARERLTPEELTAQWRDSPYANHAVRTLPEEATRRGWKVLDSTSAVDLMADEDERLDVAGRFCEAATWGELYGAAVLLMVVDEMLPAGMTEAQVLRTPLRPENVRRVCALQVFDALEARPHGLPDDDIRSPNFRRPREWSLTPSSGGTMRVVHHSRVLVFGGTPLPPSQKGTNAWIDDSVLQICRDPIRDMTSIDQAGAHTAQTLSQDVITVADARDVSTGPASALFVLRVKALALYKSMLNMVVLTGQETYQTTGRPMTGFDQLAARAKESLAHANGEPLTRLFGEAPGGLNTDGENQRGIWAQRVSGYQARKFRSHLRRLYRLIFRSIEGPTCGVEPETWRIEFLPLDELTAQGLANLRKTHAETDAILVQAQILPAEHIARSRYSAEGYSDDLLPFDPDAEDAALLAAAQANLAAPGVAPPPAPAPSSSGQRFTIEQVHAAAPQAPGADPAQPPPDQGQDAAEVLTDEAVASLAATMTEHAIARCEHGANNRCRICGIERIRGLALDEKGVPQRSAEGEPVWSVAWRPIARVGAIAITPPAG